MNDNLGKIAGNKTEQILVEDCDVSFGKFKVTDEGYGFVTTNLDVTIKNKNSATKSFYIQIEAVDNDGNRIANDYIYANNLKSGQSQKFEAFNFVSSDKVEKLKKAKFQLVEISMY